MLKSENKVVGLRQSLKALKNENVVKVYIAKDVEPKLIKDVEKECMDKNIEITYIDTMKELGKACGIDVGSTVVCILRN